MLKRFFIPLVVLLVVAAAAVYWFAGNTRPKDIKQAVPVEHFTLGNGLAVVVMPNDRIPVVAEMLVVKAGGGDDPYGKSGLAHYLEHLMFTGTAHYGEGIYNQTINRVGGESNAFTTDDFTLFYATVPQKEIGSVLAMEADRLANLSFDLPRAARELKVITEERNMRVENNAEAQLTEQLDALTFLNHPYQHPTIGWAEDMATFTAADAQQFFAQHYRTGNMLLLLAGDITLSEAKRYAQQYFANLPAGQAPDRNWPKEPPLRLKRHGEMADEKVHEPRLVRQYIAPSVYAGDTDRTAALEVYAQALGGGLTSQLYDSLVRQQKIAVNVDVDYNPLKLGPAILRIDLVPAQGITLPQLETALDAAIAASVAAPLDEATLARAKTQLKAQTIYAQDGLTPLAHLIASLYALGLNEQYFYDWPNKIAAVSAAEVQQAASAVVQPERSVTGYLLPKAAPMVAAAPQTEAPHAP